MERLYEGAMRDVEIQAKRKEDRLREKGEEVRDFLKQIEMAVEEIQLRVKRDSK